MSQVLRIRFLWVCALMVPAFALVAAALHGRPAPQQDPARVPLAPSGGPRDCCPADVNCDGTVNGVDVEPFIFLLDELSGQCSPCAGDVNADGSVNGQDIGPFVQALLEGDCGGPCEITLTECPAAFIPQGRAASGTNAGDPGNDVTFTATVTKGGPRKIRFTLSDVSSEPGVCLNFGTENDKDLKFRQTNTINPAADFDAPSADGQTITTKNKVNAITVTLTAYDYGAFGKIRACCMKDDDSACESHSELRPVPIDANGNNVADAAPQNTGPGAANAATDDKDNSPAGEGTDGDHLSRYEEYRGFMVKGTHTRTDVAAKDVFVRNNVGNVAGASLGDSGDMTSANLTAPVHPVTASELDENRKINSKNSSHHIAGDQTAILVTSGNGTPSCAGAVFGEASVVDGGSPWVPNNESHCRVCVANIEANMNTVDSRVAANGISATTTIIPVEDVPDGRTPGRTRIDDEIISYTGQNGSVTALRGDLTNAATTIRVRDTADIFADAGTLRIENELILYTGRTQVDTTLNGAINMDVVTITVASTANFANAGAFHIEQEVITYTGRDATHFTGCTRGANGTDRAAHADGATVRHAVFTGCTRGQFGSAAAAHRHLIFVRQRMLSGVTRGIAGSTAATHSGGAGVRNFADANDKARQTFGHEAGHLVALDHIDLTVLKASVTPGSWPDNGYYHQYINGGNDSIAGEFRVKP